ncbi:MAG: flagellar basal body L-ring protein FlgH [Melioribacteraceae bacterium]|nr:flagellar basal body L-ring protein FlgH [Melioribacteraceae bacterium]
MNKTIILLLLFTITLSAQDMRMNSFNSLFSDEKANQVGDAITIVVVESSQATNDARTTTSRDSEIGASFSGDAFGNPLPGGTVDLGTTSDFEGRGATSSRGIFKTKISATIDTVFSNGNMRITGKRKISINGEEQLISISGIVRPSDIQADNSVLSYNISDAEIILEGSGQIDRVQSPGWVTKLFHWLF